MGPGMFDGLGKAIGCLILAAFIGGMAFASCVRSCPVRINVERVK